MQTFWFNNINFAVEFYGAAVFVVAAWLAADAYFLSRKRNLFLKIAGFGAIAIWQTLHALDITSERALLMGSLALIAGLFFLLLYLFLETPPPRPTLFDIVFAIPLTAGFFKGLAAAAGILALLITLKSYRRYVLELNKPLRPLWLGFGLLAASFFLGAVGSGIITTDTRWIAEHALRLAAFGLLTGWVWQYLKPRLKEELMLLFVAMALAISLVVTFTFSALILERMRADASKSLEASAKSFRYGLSRLAGETEAKSVLGAMDTELAKAVTANDFSLMEKRARELKEALGVDFVGIADKDGALLWRAGFETARGESLSGNTLFIAARDKTSAGGMDRLPPEGMSVRGIAPIRKDAAVAGWFSVGNLLDAAFADSVKRDTGLEISVYDGETLYASTMRLAGTETPPKGVLLTDVAARNALFQKKTGYTGSANVLGRPYLAAYLPLKDAHGDVIGAVAVSRAEIEVAKAAIATNRLTLFSTLLIVLALLAPAYLAVRRMMEET